ncbi:hypothetical protein [Pseudonocardia sp. ICBG162]|uniref:hypothetical protein n=1 Tax=Pseudonocardia sp. ICBG162 TaxID=2846761 RepID=UPI001CF6C571|nr:hypothetical protein [Pseudonocardia sp. ICBG162]
MIRIKLIATAQDMLPEFLAGLAAEAGDPADAATADRAAQQAHARQVVLSRVVELPAVPEPGAALRAHPYTEDLTVERVEWCTDPEDGDPYVEVHLDEIDLDVLADEASALGMFQAAGWHIQQ